jgi:pimeloyl-ACP methyl ester carboxylesterase
MNDFLQLNRRHFGLGAAAVSGGLALGVRAAASTAASDFDSNIKEGFVDSGGVKIHYATMGSGPLVVMIHGFPDYWYTWRKQMVGLADKYQTVAIDQRGYNLSDKPEGVDNYAMRLLVSDVRAVIKHFGRDHAIIVGHEWGGVVAWQLALNAPQFVERLIILNVPHPRGLRRELIHNPAQAAASEYVRNYQKEGFEKQLNVEEMVRWVTDPEAKQKYIDAMHRSDLTAMLNYFRRNYPAPPYLEDTSPIVTTKMPVVMLYGLKDAVLLPPALNGTWDWMGEDFTLTTFPNAGHFVQQDAADLVARTMRAWLDR